MENLEPFEMILDGTVLVTSVTYSYDNIVIEGIPTRGRTKERILKDRGWLYDEG